MQAMTDSPDPRRSLQRLEPEQRRLCERLLLLTPSQLELPSNLPGWHVVDLAVHITRVCDSILLAVQRAIVGDDSPAFGPAAKPREDAIRAMHPAGWVSLQQDAHQHLIRLVADLTDEQLEQLNFPHPQGRRSIRWFCTQLLAEVAFHRWDLDRSLGGHERLEDGLATYLLPFLLHPAEPLIGQRRAPNGAETFSLASNGMRWVLTVNDRGTAVEATMPPLPLGEGASGEGRAQAPVIRASPGWLALAVYGRVRVDPPAFHITSGSEREMDKTSDRFAAIFGPSPVW
jgi:uncharacterized protein (TIGR03083 family)